jgi:ubiquinone/menaquinone biosynthesis C-methylase UbiE
MFVCLGDLMEADRQESSFSLCDVGCAAGDFIRYTLARFRNVSALGVDYSPQLVRAARDRVPGARFENGDANSMVAISDASFDVVTMTGTHSIFDDFRPSFLECIRISRPGGLILVTGLFNDHPVDAQVRWRYAGEFDTDWHPGYNLFSKNSVGQFLRNQERVESFSFEPFCLPCDLAPQSDPIRSWTEPKIGGGRRLVNGIMPLNVQILSIRTR